MRSCLWWSAVLCIGVCQGAIPTFRYAGRGGIVTLVGQDPARGGVTEIPTLVVPVALRFPSLRVEGKPFRMEAEPDVRALLESPVFAPFAFPTGGRTQYLDAMMRATFPEAKDWHVRLAGPTVAKSIAVDVPPGRGYVLVSKKTGRSVGVADLQFVQREVFRQVGRQEGKLVMAVTHNVTYYAEGDATICCLFGTHGTDAATGNVFVLASYLRDAPAIVQEEDIQPITEQLGEVALDPEHDPLLPERSSTKRGNAMPAWKKPVSMQPGDQGPCGGTGIATSYFLLEPTDVNRKNNFPVSKAYVAEAAGRPFHLQNVALLPWYLGTTAGLGKVFSFPDPQALPDRAQGCGAVEQRHRGIDSGQTIAAEEPEANVGGSRGRHRLIGYWTGEGARGLPFRLRDVSPQWDTILVAFAVPDKTAPEGTLRFRTPKGISREELQADIRYLKSRGKTVMISLGGGGQYFTLTKTGSQSNFVDAVTKIVSSYAFDGIDIDFETPSLVIEEGDTDFRHPTTPSIVNLIGAMRQLREQFGPKFAISLVPEGPQMPAGYRSYGGQFGSYLPIAYALRDILTFVDVQDYNTPPLEGLDGEIYQAGTVDYHAAMTELMLHGFEVAGDGQQLFPALPGEKVAIGFLTSDVTPEVVRQALDYVITGKRADGVTYPLQRPAGYGAMLGAMFWTIDDDRRENDRFSNPVGRQLHGY